LKVGYSRDRKENDEKDVMLARRKTRQITIGGVAIGGDAPITVQSMTNTDTRDVENTVAQIARLTAAGCELIRVAIVDMEAATAIRSIRDRITIPLIADIHFDARLAVAAMENGAQAIRINPGNIGGRDRLARVVDAAKNNGGSAQETWPAHSGGPGRPGGKRSA